VWVEISVSRDAVQRHISMISPLWGRVSARGRRPQRQAEVSMSSGRLGCWVVVVVLLRRQICLLEVDWTLFSGAGEKRSVIVVMGRERRLTGTLPALLLGHFRSNVTLGEVRDRSGHV